MIGTIIGNYKIIRKIGEGGMGAVYLARDLTLEREVALKVIAPALAKKARLMARFKIEAIAQARLNHPNVVTIYSFEQVGDFYFIVMEYIRGKSLKEIIKKRELSFERALDIYKQVLKAVEFAHSKGIIHRDIKPGNILVTEDGIAKIGDFGIAKIEGIEGLTRAGASMGTPLYSSPEQILGKRVDYRADIYSLGVLLFEMMTGRPPFTSDTGSDYEIQRAHVESKPPKPSSLNPWLPSRIDRIVLKCMEKDPEKRYSSVRELRKEVEKIDPGEYRVPYRRRKISDFFLRLGKGISYGLINFPSRLRSDRRVFFLTLTALVLSLVFIYLLARSTTRMEPVTVAVPSHKEKTSPEKSVKKSEPEKEEKTTATAPLKEKKSLSSKKKGEGKEPEQSVTTPRVSSMAQAKEEISAEEKPPPAGGKRISKQGTSIGVHRKEKPKQNKQKIRFTEKSEKVETSRTVPRKKSVTTRQKLKVTKRVSPKGRIPSGAYWKIRTLVETKLFYRASMLGEKYIARGAKDGRIYLHTARAYFLMRNYKRALQLFKIAFSRLGYIAFEVKLLPGLWGSESVGWLILGRGYIKYVPEDYKNRTFLLKARFLKEVKPTKRLWEEEWKLEIESRGGLKAKFVLRKRMTVKEDVEFIRKFILKSVKGGVL